MKREGTDRERALDVKRKKMFFGIATVVVIITVAICVYLSRLAVGNVDVKKGTEKLKELEKIDIAAIEAEIQAQEEVERQADEEYKNRPLTEKFARAVIIGDSIANGFMDYEVLEASSVVTEVGVTLTSAESLIETTVNLNPSVVFLALGLNDITETGGDTEQFVENYRVVISALREALPEVKICINSIQPVQQKAIDKRPEYAGIAEYNEALITFCEEESFTFVDCRDLVQEEYYEPDGEHMVSDYYPLWGNRMAEVAKL